ncbi:hydrogenase formation protein HypD [Microbulbifer sp. OS29]|uniref:Hydrogenase maturation factor n=1 Tax=Microbulbifer okhotskensis TaxID=2926617 RepID=A0A9X2J725_9GAMM|nr:hydrogenase formation protein HypD [Microbulbifer okhotskensis]MCO1336104.1 hydrogenase formation protein HypD [Microbulbifer okhotskensis]
MKYLQEYRNGDCIRTVAAELEKTSSRPWTLMEICGGQTHAIAKYGLQQLLPPGIQLVHGPGCPVCVTPQEIIDGAITIAAMPDVIFCSYGDMLRVPGSVSDLLQVKAGGGDIRIIYSPLQALHLAEQNPNKQVVFLAIGFETTATANALTLSLAKQKSLHNFSALISQFLVAPAIRSICARKDCQIQGFLAAGHVCAITGYEQYHQLAENYHIPIVITGFEPLDIIEGVLRCIRQLEGGHYRVENQYQRAVTQAGNRTAQSLLKTVFKISAQHWRGIGEIPTSGLILKEEYASFDAARRFNLPTSNRADNRGCLSGEILLGLKKPCDCPHFAQKCHPQQPLGAPMVSSEGACAAYYHYRDQVSVNGSALPNSPNR